MTSRLKKYLLVYALAFAAMYAYSKFQFYVYEPTARITQQRFHEIGTMTWERMGKGSYPMLNRHMLSCGAYFGGGGGPECPLSHMRNNTPIDASGFVFPTMTGPRYVVTELAVNGAKTYSLSLEQVIKNWYADSAWFIRMQALLLAVPFIILFVATSETSSDESDHVKEISVTDHASGFVHFYKRSYTPSRSDYVVAGGMLLICVPMALSMAFTGFSLSYWISLAAVGLALLLLGIALNLIRRRVTLYKDKIEVRSLWGQGVLLRSEIRGYEKYEDKHGLFIKIFPKDKKRKALKVTNAAVMDETFEEWLSEFRDLGVAESQYYAGRRF